jgi:basic amino acid/polyamine antiporter, APA family
VCAATVCVGWSAYFRSFLSSSLGIHLPMECTTSPIAWDIDEERFHSTGGYMDLPAMIIALLMTTLLCLGIKESSRFNNIIVGVKIFVIFMFIFVMGPQVDPQNWKPFLPPNEQGKFGRFGVTGVLQGATTVFFS